MDLVNGLHRSHKGQSASEIFDSLEQMDDFLCLPDSQVKHKIRFFNLAQVIAVRYGGQDFNFNPEDLEFVIE